MSKYNEKRPSKSPKVSMSFYLITFKKKKKIFLEIIQWLIFVHVNSYSVNAEFTVFPYDKTLLISKGKCICYSSIEIKYVLNEIYKNKIRDY